MSDLNIETRPCSALFIERAMSVQRTKFRSSKGGAMQRQDMVPMMMARSSMEDVNLEFGGLSESKTTLYGTNFFNKNIY